MYSRIAALCFCAMVASAAAMTGLADKGGPTFHLAVYNRALFKDPMNSDKNKEFVASLGPVMQIAEKSKGFIWRFRSGVDGPGDPDYQEVDRLFPGLALLNLSIWETVSDLRHFIYKSGHSAYYRRKTEWFEEESGDLPPKAPCPFAPHHVLWWVPAGGPPPTFADAASRCEHLLRHGDTAEAFTLKRPFPPPGADRSVDSARVGGPLGDHASADSALAGAGPLRRALGSSAALGALVSSVALGMLAVVAIRGARRG